MPTIDFRRTLTAVVLGLAAATPALAHHSFAMFDRSRTLILKGAVKDFQWTNPHAWIQLQTAAEGDGGGKEWSIEMGSPNMMQRQGWHSDTIKPGDKVVAAINPLRDGAAGGTLISVTLEDGRVLGPGAGKIRPLSEIKPN